MEYTYWDTFKDMMASGLSIGKGKAGSVDQYTYRKSNIGKIACGSIFVLHTIGQIATGKFKGRRAIVGLAGSLFIAALATVSAAFIDAQVNEWRRTEGPYIIKEDINK